MTQNDKVSHTSSRIHQIYDSIFKTALTLSVPAVIHFMNGLYGTKYPTNSVIEYNWTESHDKRLKKTLADTILTINHTDAYHLEGQMTKDKKIVFRVFQYGFQYSSKVIQTDEDGLIFPESVIIYLDKENYIPQYQSIHISLGREQEVTYKVKTFCYQDYSIDELMKRKMVILIPFQLLKYKDVMNQNPSKEDIVGLKKLISEDIIGNIYRSFQVGDIVYSDLVILMDMVKLLGESLYGESEICREEGVLAMLAEPIVFESVIMRDEYEEKLAAKDQKISDVVFESVVMRDEYEEQLANKDMQLSAKDLEIARLNAELEELKTKLH